MEIITEISPHFEGVLALAAQASHDYDAFVFDSPAQSAAVQRALIEQRASECAPPHCRLLVENGELVGMAAALTAGDLAACRMRAAMALSALGLFAAGSPLRQRLRLAGQTLSQLADGEYYLARLTVTQAARGHGFGRLLMDGVVQEAGHRGCRRVVLDVNPGNESAIQLYQSAGFVSMGTGSVRDDATGRRLEHVHMAKPLT